MSETQKSSQFEFEHLFARRLNGGCSCAADAESMESIADIFERLQSHADGEETLDKARPFDDGGMLGGYFDADGKRLDPDSIPRPGLCLLCAENNSEDWETEILCNLTRLEQRESGEFNCEDFVPSNPDSASAGAAAAV